jgi:ssDNA thymidine ADP-ribosyltransferase, DarT
MSSKLLTPDKAYIFRILHRQNLPLLLKDGCMCRNRVAQGTYAEIGNQELIARRKDRVVPCAPGGTLGDYVPFYFTPYSPMLYNIKTGYGVPQQSGNPPF